MSNFDSLHTPPHPGLDEDNQNIDYIIPTLDSPIPDHWLNIDVPKDLAESMYLTQNIILLLRLCYLFSFRAILLLRLQLRVSLKLN